MDQNALYIILGWVFFICAGALIGILLEKIIVNNQNIVKAKEEIVRIEEEIKLTEQAINRCDEKIRKIEGEINDATSRTGMV
jgi:primosomal protein N''